MAGGWEERSGSKWWVRYRVLLYLVLGLVVLDLVIAAFRDVWRAYDPDDYLERVHGCQDQPIDLVVVGGSPVSEGIDPKVLAGVEWRGTSLERAYNLGLPGATTSEIWHAVEHGVTHPPRLLVYGITASDINDDRQEPHGPRSLMSVQDVLDWVGHRPSTAKWVARQFAQGQLIRLWQLYRYRNGIRLWAADQVEKLWPGAFPDAVVEARQNLHYATAMRGGTGYAPNPTFQGCKFERFCCAGGLSVGFNFLERYRIGEHLQYVHRLIDWAESQGVSIVLVDMPVNAYLDERLYPQAFASYRQALAEVERTRGVTVIRAGRQTVGLDEGDFADLIHLNVRGAARFSTWLRQALSDSDTRTASR